ncbi:HNH endonuclease, partial [Arthrobacter sp. B2a2-09]|nr:HNH endonuclease [Arthrobacter sp. B2a2-09]
HRQGAFIRKPRRGLHHLEIFATAEQFETLATVMNTATNPRLRHDTDGPQDTDPTRNTGRNTGGPAGLAQHDGVTHPPLDRRSRPQKLL